MAIKKSALYSSLWQSCDELRGGMDASQYKDYVLTLLFVKYVSDKYLGDRNALIVVLEGGSFADMVRLKGDKEIGDKVNKIIGRLAEENDLKGVIDVADFNDEDKLGKGKEMVDRLSKLIAKKRAIKTAAMQQLLTGKQRLPGFEKEKGYKQTEVGMIPADWRVNIISDFASVKTGPFGSSLHESDYVEDGTPIITVEHLSEHGIVHENLPLVSDFDRARLKAYSLDKNDIVFSRVGSVDRNALISSAEEGWLFSGRLLRVRVNNSGVYPPYLSYHFHSEPFKQRVRAVAVGQTMPSLNTQILKAILVVVPTMEEQTAIATVLSDMDAEIAALEARRDKTKAIKQGMMQELLTGKIRLIESG